MASADGRPLAKLCTIVGIIVFFSALGPSQRGSNKLANDLDNDDAWGGPPSPKRRTFGGDKRYSNVQRHYDRHALRSARLSKDEAFEQRRNGVAFPLKRFHNLVKKKLLEEVARRFRESSNLFADGESNPPLTLLDVGCGRACDLFKWHSSNVDYALGIDASEVIIEEANRRLGEQDQQQHQQQSGANRHRKYSSSNFKTCAEFQFFEHFDREKFVFRNLTGLNNKNKRFHNIVKRNGFALATCMFSLHYFFRDEAAATQALGNIADSLQDGGYAVMLFPDGHRVQELLGTKCSSSNTNTTRANFGKYSNGVLSLRRHWNGSVQPFGSGYEFELVDTVTQSTQNLDKPANDTTAASDQKSVNIEYLVSCANLKSMAQRAGLRMVDDLRSSYQLRRLFEDNMNKKEAGFYHFNPPYRQTDPALAQASSLFVAVVFIKDSIAAIPTTIA